MGRFYQATRVNFADYIDDLATETPQIGPIDSSLGTVEVLPQDRPIAGQKIGQYEQELNRITQALQRGANVQQVQPQIQDLRSRIRQDYQYGELAAMRDRLAQFKETEKNVAETLADYPSLRDKALGMLRTQGVSPLNYDPQTGQYGQVTVPSNIVRPFSQDDINEWMSTVKSNLKEKILEEAQAQELDVSKFDSIWEVGRKVGIDETRANEIVVGSIPREGLDAAQMVADLTGTGVNERMFIDPQTGRFNENTQWGRLAASLFNQIQSEDFEGNILKREDFGAKQAAREATQKRVASFKDRLKSKGEDEAATEFVNKFREVWQGNPEAFDKADPGGVTLVDNWFQGYDIGGQPIVALKKVPGQAPMLEVATDEQLVPITAKEYKELSKDTDVPIIQKGKNYYRVQGGKLRAVPLDYETIQNIDIPQSVKSKIMKNLVEEGLVDPTTGKVQIDPQQDTTRAQTQLRLNNIWNE